jgi:hypothetical protein
LGYVSARLDKKTEMVDVVERTNGKRIFNSYPIDYGFYIDDPNGKFITIYNTPVTKITPKSSSEFYKELAILKGKRLWESDINPIFKILAKHYKGQKTELLHIGYLDIEVDFKKYKYSLDHKVKIRRKK